ncbi:MAG: AraC family transcriptional regulator [Saprospiraceae bacterium]|nr:AraC family transcriptional regulator [Saprospiraceae bacterium]
MIKDIKTYSDVNRNDPMKSFGISRMEDIHDKHGGKPDAPHRHNYYTVLLVQKAKGQHFIDFKGFELKDGQVYFIAPGQVHQILEAEKSFGYSMVFSTQFLVENHIPLSFIEDLNLFNDYGDSPPLQLDDEMLKSLSGYCEQIIRFYHSDDKFRDAAIGSILKLFLIGCNNVCTVPRNHPQQIESGNSILRQFKTLVEDHFTEWHATSQYAEVLNISPDHLNRTVKSLIGKTAKEYIQSRITTAAKRMLYFSGLSTKEIAYELGFSEPAHFSAFFKNCSGMSPSQFKKNR